MKVTKQVRYNVERFYYDNYRVTETEKVEMVRGETQAYPQGEHGMKLYQHKDDEGNFILPGGKIVPEDFVYYYPSSFDQTVILSSTPAPVTNSEYEQRLNEKKSKIQIVQPKYIYDLDRDVRLYGNNTKLQESQIDIRDVM